MQKKDIEKGVKIFGDCLIYSSLRGENHEVISSKEVLNFNQVQTKRLLHFVRNDDSLVMKSHWLNQTRIFQG